MTEVEQIREALGTAEYALMVVSAQNATEALDGLAKARALLDGAVGLVREGDVVLSAEEARLIRDTLGGGAHFADPLGVGAGDAAVGHACRPLDERLR